jgi:hypothetical protein
VTIPADLLRRLERLEVETRPPRDYDAEIQEVRDRLLERIHEIKAMTPGDRAALPEVDPSTWSPAHRLLYDRIERLSRESAGNGEL